MHDLSETDGRLEGGEFAGKSVLVTGGGSGIGAAVARRFAAANAKVSIADLDLPGAQGVATSLKPKGMAYAVDVANSQQVFRLFSSIAQDRGRIDVVIHCAGVDDPETKATIAAQHERGLDIDVTSQLSDERWLRMLNTNLSGTFFVIRASLQHMLPAGGGVIVVIGSQAGVNGVPAYPHYSASKGGVHALCRSVAAEVANRGVRVNSIAPGEIDTPMLARTPKAMTGGFTTRAPIGRRGRAEEVAALAQFLASESSSYVVGETVLINGGLLTV